MSGTRPVNVTPSSAIRSETSMLPVDPVTKNEVLGRVRLIIGRISLQKADASRSTNT